MARIASLIRKPRGVHWWISVALIVFGLVMLVALGIQSFSSQHLIEHRFWIGLLRSVSEDHAARIRKDRRAPLPDTGNVRSWYVEEGVATAGVPSYLLGLPPGIYSTEDAYGVFEERAAFDDRDSFHALIVDLPPGRLITEIDIEELDSKQNLYAMLSLVWVIILAALIGWAITWLHANLVRPVRDLADRMRKMDPRDIGARLPTTYKQEEIRVIAQASNAHLERVEQFIERERSLLDQASHEFRTPIAVIAGAVDVLKQIRLPDASRPALRRIEHAVGDLSETMVALLYLAREPDPESEPEDVTVLHEFLPRLVQDHEHLLRGKAAQLRVAALEPTLIAAPDAIVRIAVSNLIRNAIENTEAGYVEIALGNGVISVADSGSGFDPVEAARRYRDSLRQAAPTRGQGLGLFLIGRICERFNWKLEIEATAMGGTRATLDVSAGTFAA